jgi:hypothetical protein
VRSSDEVPVGGRANAVALGKDLRVVRRTGKRGVGAEEREGTKHERELCAHGAKQSRAKGHCQQSGTPDALHVRMTVKNLLLRARAGQTSTLVVLVAGAMPLLACASLGDAAAERARSELECPVEPIQIVQRADLSPATFEASGCGKRVRYTCRQERRGVPATIICTPEPTPTIELVER